MEIALCKSRTKNDIAIFALSRQVMLDMFITGQFKHWIPFCEHGRMDFTIEGAFDPIDRTHPILIEHIKKYGQLASRNDSVIVVEEIQLNKYDRYIIENHPGGESIRVIRHAHSSIA